MKYYLKVWLFTVLVAPLVFLVELIINQSVIVKSAEDGLVVWLAGVLVGGACGLPCLLIFWVIDQQFQRKQVRPMEQKIIFALTGMAAIWIAFTIMNWKFIGDLSWRDAYWPIIFSGSLIVATLIFRLKRSRPSKNYFKF